MTSIIEYQIQSAETAAFAAFQVAEREQRRRAGRNADPLEGFGNEVHNPP
jgi:hypothetical protein